MSDIKAVIFDCFGVLTTDGWLRFKDQHFRDEPDKMARATGLNHMVDSGLIAYQDFLEEVSEMADVSVDTLKNTLHTVVANDALFDFITTELKPNYKIGLLSNVAHNWISEMFRPEQAAVFDAVVLSHETGIIKPDLRAYTIAAGRLEVPEEACMFVDDQERNVTGAKEAGMQAFQYHSLEQALDEFKRRTS